MNVNFLMSHGKAQRGSMSSVPEESLGKMIRELTLLGEINDIPAPYPA